MQKALIENRGGEISKMYTCPRTTVCKKSTCPSQDTTCPYINKCKGKICQHNDLMNALQLFSHYIALIFSL